MTIKLKGITWDHSRGFLPVAATAQRFCEMNPGVEIEWHRRSLQAFADYPIDRLANEYDLLVIDHPWAGFAAAKGDVLVSLDQHLPQAYLDDQAANSVGQSHLSYNFDGVQTALAIDAATPVATYRPDLFARDGREVPQTWTQLLELARERKVIFAGIPIDTLMQFYMLCATQGADLFVDHETVVSNEHGVQALEQLRELTMLCPDEMLNWNPIKVYDALSTRDDLYYCPFAYGYSNYSRPGYSRHLLKSTDMVSIGEHGRLQSTLGGTGLAISTASKHLDVALEYAMYTASPEIQKTLYVENGGQPGHRAAWLDQDANARSLDFFIETLPALDRAYLRPRYDGYFHFQDHAGDVVRDYVRGGGAPLQVLDKLRQLYRESRGGIV